jgi:uncharacterized Fe-S cluster protein YjdI
VTPYYQDDLVTIYHGDCLDGQPFLGNTDAFASVMVTDPPYGRGYRSSKAGRLARSISGDMDTAFRNLALARWGSRPALVFGQWQMPHPIRTKAVLIWDAYPLGMGDTTIPWKPCAHEIYVLGTGFTGRRDSCVLTGFAPVQSLARNGRTHPHEKPVELMEYLIRRCPSGTIFDPFMGSGSTLVAAKRAGRGAIGIEIEDRYCEIAAQRCSQEVLGLSA